MQATIDNIAEHLQRVKHRYKPLHTLALFFLTTSRYRCYWFHFKGEGTESQIGLSQVTSRLTSTVLSAVRSSQSPYFRFALTQSLTHTARMIPRKPKLDHTLSIWHSSVASHSL